jgi:hypothetical protein
VTSHVSIACIRTIDTMPRVEKQAGFIRGSAERIPDSIVNGAQAPPHTLATPWQLSHATPSGILHED